VWFLSANLDYWPYTKFLFIPFGFFFIAIGVFLLFRKKGDEVEELKTEMDIETISRRDDMVKVID